MANGQSRRRRAKAIEKYEERKRSIESNGEGKELREMKSKDRASSREPSHTSNFIRVAIIVLAALVLLIGLAKLVAYTKILGLK